MNRKYLVIAAMIGGALSFTRPVFSETFLAIGLPEGGPSNGWMYASSSTETDAVNLCSGITQYTGKNQNNGISDHPSNVSVAEKACKIVGDLKNQCFAIASNGTATTPASALGWIIAQEKDAAETGAMTKCDAMRSNDPSPCVMRVSDCDVTK
jgi:hypothetical protein